MDNPEIICFSSLFLGFFIFKTEIIMATSWTMDGPFQKVWNPPNTRDCSFFKCKVRILYSDFPRRLRKRTLCLRVFMPLVLNLELFLGSRVKQPILQRTPSRTQSLFIHGCQNTLKITMISGQGKHIPKHLEFPYCQGKQLKQLLSVSVRVLGSKVLLTCNWTGIVLTLDWT